MTIADTPDFQGLLHGEPAEWLTALPTYQRSLIGQMLQTQSPTEVAVSWLATSGPKDTAPFGGVRAGASLFYDNLLTEVQRLFCGHDRYAQEREELKSAASWTKMGIVSFIAMTIGPQVGASAVVIAPVVAMILAVLSSAGKETVCDGIKVLIADRAAGRATDNA